MKWTEKLASYQADPPTPAWNEIEKTLQQQGSSLFPHTATPPTDSWENISTRLSYRENYYSSRAFHWLRPALRYAAIIAFLALVTTTLVNNSFRNILIETIQGPGIKAALTDTPQVISKDSSKIKIEVKQIPR